MKKLFLLLLLIAFAQLSKSQDLIVTTNNDSLNCQIIEKKGAFLIYKIIVDGAYQSRAVKDEFVLKTEVGYFLKSQNSKQNIQVLKSKNPNEGVFLKIGFNKAQLLEINDNNIPNDFKEYYKDLANSISVSAEIERIVTPRFAFGLNYELYIGNASMKNYGTPGPYGTTINFDFEEKLTIHTVSPKFSYRKNISGDNNLVVLSGMLDYNFFNNIFSVDESNGSYYASGDIKGRKFGLSIAGSYERIINNDLRVGVSCLFRASTLDKVKINGEEETLIGTNQININRLNFGLYLAFR